MESSGPGGSDAPQPRLAASGSVRRRNDDEAEALRRVAGGALGIRTVAWSPNGKMLAVGGYDEQVSGSCLWLVQLVWKEMAADAVFEPGASAGGCQLGGDGDAGPCEAEHHAHSGCAARCVRRTGEFAVYVSHAHAASSAQRPYERRSHGASRVAGSKRRAGAALFRVSRECEREAREASRQSSEPKLNCCAPLDDQTSAAACRPHQQRCESTTQRQTPKWACIGSPGRPTARCWRLETVRLDISPHHCPC